MRRLFRLSLIATLLLALVPLGVFVVGRLRGPRLPARAMLHVRLAGPVAESLQPSLTELLRGQAAAVTLRGLDEAIRAAADDPRIVGLLLDLRDVQLGAAQRDELCDAVAAYRRSHKWSAAYLETAGEFGGGDSAYALATCAEQIVLSPPGEVALSGLRSEVPFVREALARLHVSAFTEQRHEYKNFANTFTEDGFTPAHREALAGVLDGLQGDLVRRMAAGRGQDEATVRGWVRDSPHPSEAALAQHMVDRVAYWDELYADLQRTCDVQAPLVDVPRYAAARGRGSRQGPVVALVVMAGQISSGEGGRGPLGQADGVGSETLTRALRRAREDHVAGVVIRLDSPGGSYIASDLIRREVQLTREANIPVVVSMGNVAASGGYFIASEADHIVAQPGTITGSIGVVAASFALREALQHWLGVSFGVYEALPHPGNLSWLDPPDAATRDRVAHSVDRIYADFVGKVAKARHRSVDAIEAVARGRIWSGRQAVDRGLADELGGLDVAMEALRHRLQLSAEAPLQLRPYPAPDTWAVLLRNVAAGQVGTDAEVARLPAPVVRLVRSLDAALRPEAHGALWAPLPCGLTGDCRP